ncbi:hypothetical protein MKX08_003217 [Trichoderma sp. CBMAI-0020]|nr:hypothetical protein MKX08_003217 [Trichoderma sp. CBMAI-0020]
MVRLFTLALAATSAMTSVHAEGINCEGSGACGLILPGVRAADALTSFLYGVDDNAWYNNGQLIACYHATASLEAGAVPVCAFLQNTGGTNGAIIKQLAGYIPGHGCAECGSVPYYFPQGNNNVDDGELTYNVVSNPEFSIKYLDDRLFFPLQEISTMPSAPRRRAPRRIAAARRRHKIAMAIMFFSLVAAVAAFLLMTREGYSQFRLQLAALRACPPCLPCSAARTTNINNEVFGERLLAQIYSYARALLLGPIRAAVAGKFLFPKTKL